VSREENSEDRRMLELRVTDKGETILTSLREETISAMAEILARMSTEELSSLARRLVALARLLRLTKENLRHEHD
jgi:DNA-binding MarR family transcriptional regulator